jgi:hypothetical protein
MVERFFRDLTQKRLRRGVFRDVEELIMAIGDYIDKHNETPKPIVWTLKPATLLKRSSVLAKLWIIVNLLAVLHYIATIHCRERLGGLLKYYCRAS